MSSPRTVRKHAAGYVLSPEQFAGRRNVHLRVAPSLNNQQNGINWASDFAFEARLEALLGP